MKLDKLRERNKRLENKVKYISEYIEQLEGRRKVDSALYLAEKISKVQNKKVLEEILDNFIEGMNYTLATYRNLDTIKPDKIQKMELAPDKIGQPTMLVQVKDNGQDIYNEFPLVKGYEIHFCNEFLRSLDLGIDIEFQTYVQYGQLIWKCFDLLKQKKEVTV